MNSRGRHHHRRRLKKMSIHFVLLAALVCCILCQAFSHSPRRQHSSALAVGWRDASLHSASSSRLCLSSGSEDVRESSTELTTDEDKNSAYIQGLIENVQTLLDKWILSGSPITQKQIANVYSMIQSQAHDEDQVKQAVRLIQRAGLKVPNGEATTTQANSSDKLLGTTDEELRRQQAKERLQWEQARAVDGIEDFRKSVDATSNKGDEFPRSELPAATQQETVEAASTRASQLVAKAGAATAFDGETLGIGGLDDVIAQVRRRVWIPLAAPPSLLNELGIRPVRGCLLYGRPGCGKTLLARQLGRILSPARPITVVSGPEILDKFVGSSEKNLRYIFDNPPPISESYRRNEPDGGEALEKAALHVIVMDEFDAIARTRGGRDGAGDQSDAGVARDSVVNQLLAKMDGVDPLVVPTLVIGLTNKRSLIDQALLRPGRFEVQVEVPPPATVEQRKSILHVHTRDMHKAGRILVRDAPENSPAAHVGNDSALSYDELLEALATICEGFSGASLAGVARAAASHALERAVEQFAQHVADTSLLNDCIVSWDDFESAITDIREDEGDHDWTETDDEKS